MASSTWGASTETGAAWLSFDRTVTLRMFCRSMPMPSSKHSSMDLCCKAIELLSFVHGSDDGSANRFALSRNVGPVERGPVAKRGCLKREQRRSRLPNCDHRRDPQ